MLSTNHTEKQRLDGRQACVLDASELGSISGARGSWDLFNWEALSWMAGSNGEGWMGLMCILNSRLFHSGPVGIVLPAFKWLKEQGLPPPSVWGGFSFSFASVWF